MFSVDHPFTLRDCEAAFRFAPHDGTYGPAYADRKLVMLCMTPRSGSSHLGSLMKANGLGWGAEHFNIRNPAAVHKRLGETGPLTFDKFVRRTVETRTQDGVFCAKVDWLHYAPLYYFGAHQHYFANASFILLTRKDLLMQAISRFVAHETRYFHSTDVGAAHTLNEDVAFDYDRIMQHLKFLVFMQAAWDSFFASQGISPLRITYEELSGDEAGMIRRIADHIGIQLTGEPRIDSAYSMVRNARNEVLRDQFVARGRQIHDNEGAALMRRFRKSTAA